MDTAILLCGILTCRQHFANAEIDRLASAIFGRVDWTWLSEDTPILPHGWMPETGFLQYRWDNYSEMMMMYLLGLGSATHPLPAEAWNAWKRTKFEYDGIGYIGSFAPLIHPPVFASVVRFSQQARSICGLFSEFDHRHGCASAFLPGLEQTVPHLHR